nr:MAG TPA: hypothetical protein [Caudoviricetes sp.]
MKKIGISMFLEYITSSALLRPIRPRKRETLIYQHFSSQNVGISEE